MGTEVMQELSDDWLNWPPESMACFFNDSGMECEESSREHYDEY